MTVRLSLERYRPAASIPWVILVAVVSAALGALGVVMAMTLGPR